MYAAVLHRHGRPPVHEERDGPEATPGHTLVRVAAAPVVPLDLLCASGTSYFGPPTLPYVPGVQGVGSVVESEAHSVGARVWFSTHAGMAAGDGSLADLCVVADSDLVLIDTPLPDTTVAALGLSAIAAHMALTWRGSLVAGERVLVLGGGGAVGQAGIGVARAKGASRVVAVARPGASTERAHAAGADAVVPLSDDAAELTAAIEAACGGAVDVVLDPVFGVAASAASRALAPGGRLVNLGGGSGDLATFSSAVLRSRSASVLGYTNNALTPEQRAQALGEVLAFAESGTLRVGHDVLPLAAVDAAWAAVERGGARVVLVPGA